MSITALITAVAWYLGGLGVFWYVSIQYRNGAALSRLAPLMAAVCLMLITASALYYDYIDTPVYHALSYAWYGVVGWIVYIAYASLRVRTKK